MDSNVGYQSILYIVYSGSPTIFWGPGAGRRHRRPQRATWRLLRPCRHRLHFRRFGPFHNVWAIDWTHAILYADQ